MNDKTGGAAQDELAAAARIKAHMSGLDQYIPTPPPFDRIEGRLRPGRADWGRGRVGRAGRPEGQTVRSRRPLGAMLAAAVIVLAAALVIGPGMWLSAVGPAGTTATPPGPVATWAPTLPPTSTPTASATVVPTATPLVTASGLSQKTILDSGPDLGAKQAQSISWSPSGTYIAVTLGASGKQDDVHILRSDGTPVETVTAWDLAWIDDSTYVGTDSGAGSTDAMLHTFVGHVGSSARTDLPEVAANCRILGGGRGAIALMTNAACTQYVIWTPKGLSAERSGEPVVFSPDGSLLAVVHDPTPGADGALVAPSPGPEATLDIVRTSTGESVARAGKVAWYYDTTIIFSPDGKRVAYLIRMPERPSGEGFGILDIASGTVSVLDAGLGPVRGWLADDRLLVASQTPGAPAPKGLAVTALRGAADTVAVSSTGRIASGLSTDQSTESSTLALDFGAQHQTLELPGYPGLLVWSPDGSKLLVACHTAMFQPPGQVVLVGP
jgi:WD40-like Beta Propeller Repeat